MFHTYPGGKRHLASEVMTEIVRLNSLSIRSNHFMDVFIGGARYSLSSYVLDPTHLQQTTKV